MIGSLKKINKILDKNLRIYLAFIFVIIFITMILETLSLASFYPLLELLLSSDNLNSNSKIIQIYFNYLDFFNFDKDNIVNLTILIVTILYVAKIVILLFCNWQNSNFEFAIRFYLTKKLYKNYLNKDYESLTKYHSADIIKNVDYEISMVQSGISGLMMIITEGIIFTGILIFLFFFNAKITTSLIIFCVILFILLQFSYNKLLVSWGNTSQKYNKLRTQNFIETFNAIKEIKIFRKENLFYDLMNNFNKKFFKINRQEKFLRNIPKAVLELSLIIIVSGYLIYLVKLDYNFENYFAQVGIYLIAAYRAFPSINRIIVSLQRFKFATPYVNNICDQFKNTNISENEKDTHEKFNDFQFDKSLEIRNISYSYNKSENVLNNLSLKFVSGNIYGIKGSSGSGKTTLLNLISGLLAPGSGEILVDNRVIHKKNYNNIFKYVSYVPQNIFLFDTTIAKNIHLNISENETQNFEKLNYLIEKMDLSEKISGLKNGLETNVGERGVNLSGGQIQRIGIARALYHNPKLLILDEATNAIEKDLEAKVLNFLNSIKKDKIIILVAHRDSAFRNCDQIFEIPQISISK